VTNLRAISEAALATTLEGLWSAQVTLIGPLGAKQVVRGQVVHDTVKRDPATGAVIEVVKSAVSLRRSSLSPVPGDGENWAFFVPRDATDDSGTETMYMESAPVGGRTLGIIVFHLSNTRQSV
jgi:hypothetical protein